MNSGVGVMLFGNDDISGVENREDVVDVVVCCSVGDLGPSPQVGVASESVDRCIGHRETGCVLTVWRG